MRSDACGPGFAWGVPVRGPARHLWQALVELVFPSRCAVCRDFWWHAAVDGAPSPAGPSDGQDRGHDHPRDHLKVWVCPDCLAKCQVLSSPLCLRCGLMFKSRAGHDHHCSDCLQSEGYFDRARSVGVYQDGLMALVHQLKYRRRLALAAPMGRMLHDTFTRYWRTRTVDLVVPVPLHARRLRRRGFNQASILLQAWQRAAARDPKGEVTPVTALDALIRVRRTRSQTGLNRRERRRNIRGAFAVSEREAIQQRRLLLIDDVFTTGATVEEAARTLRAAGAAAVDVLTFARTPR